VPGISYQKSEIRKERRVTGKPKLSSFEDLEVFQRAYRISLDVHKASLRFPNIEQRALADQIRRASKSVCGNVAEGFGKQRRSGAEFKRYLLMAIGSADEMQVWLRYCSDLGYVEKETCEGWRDEYRQIARMLQGLYSSWSAPSDH
jgi:four helix bundle protein